MPDENSQSPERQSGEGSLPPKLAQDSSLEEIPDADTVEGMIEDLDLPEPKQKAVRTLVQVVAMKSSMWSGPYPHPETLKKYNDAFPNGAERIFQETQKQTDHRIRMEQMIVPGQISQSKRGQWMGFGLALVVLILGFVLILQNHDTAGITLISVDVVSLAIIFVLGKLPNLRNNKDSTSPKELQKPE